MDEVDGAGGAGEGGETFDEVLQEFGGQLSLVEFTDWLDSLVVERHAKAVDAMIRMMFDVAYDGETVGQFRLRVKNEVIREWQEEERLAEEDRNNRRAADGTSAGRGMGRELGLPGYYRG